MLVTGDDTLSCLSCLTDENKNTFRMDLLPEFQISVIASMIPLKILSHIKLKRKLLLHHLISSLHHHLFSLHFHQTVDNNNKTHLHPEHHLIIVTYSHLVFFIFFFHLFSSWSDRQVIKGWKQCWMGVKKIEREPPTISMVLIIITDGVQNDPYLMTMMMLM